MSDYESHSGKIRKVFPQVNENFEQLCKRLWVENGQKEDDYDKEQLFDEFYEKYLKINNEIWEVVEHEDLDDEDMFCRLSRNSDGTVSFHTRYYNGGTCMSEMIEEALVDFDEENSDEEE